MRVAVILCSEKQRIFETISLSVNMMPELVNHLVGNT